MILNGTRSIGLISSPSSGRFASASGTFEVSPMGLRLAFTSEPVPNRGLRYANAKLRFYGAIRDCLQRIRGIRAALFSGPAPWNRTSVIRPEADFRFKRILGVSRIENGCPQASGVA